MKVEDLDHLGIIAGIIDQMGLVERVNGCLGTHPQQIVSPGLGVKAMILNGLGFVSAPLYLYEGFFEGKATEHLLGEGIKASHLNDDYLGRLLDKIWDYGNAQLFSAIAMDAYRVFELDVRRYHLDSSSLSVHGVYAGQEVPHGSIEITHGYSRDHRPDLKQFIVEMICANDGEVPLAFSVASGNQSDKAVFAQRLKAFAHQWNVEGMLVADSALYSADNLVEMGQLRWITRVPLSLGAAQTLVRQFPSEALSESPRQGYRLGSVCSTYGGIEQQWVVVENQARIESDRHQINKQVAKQLQLAQKQLRALCQIDFRCQADALLQTQTLASTWSYHTLANIEVVEHRHYNKPGRPPKGVQPKLTYRIEAIVVSDPVAIEQAQRRAGRFILATNVVDDPDVTPQSVFNDYKGQQAPERGFGLLKDPLFFTSSVFLKTPQRIAALATIMGLSLMVYTLAQRQLRTALAQVNSTVPDQRHRPTRTPTLRWVFQCFQAIHLVWIQGQRHISNLTPQRRKILQFLGAPCQKYYLIC